MSINTKEGGGKNIKIISKVSSRFKKRVIFTIRFIKIYTSLSPKVVLTLNRKRPQVGLDKFVHFIYKRLPRQPLRSTIENAMES